MSHNPMIRFEIDTKRFVSDPLEGETIIMDMVAGRLFLLEEGAATVWDHIVRGGARDELLTLDKTNTNYYMINIKQCIQDQQLSKE